MKKLITILGLLLACANVNAQKEAAIWYFGRNAGVDFNSGNPIPLTNGQIDISEGTATVSDANGNLLFYTDGRDVWNRNHQIMPNGTGLLGHNTSTNSAIFVPKPNDPNVYYIFTADQTANPKGINYSELNIALDGGLGDITATKNIRLIAPAAEKLTAVKHANGTDYWVLAHDWANDAYLAYLITDTGVQHTPVISNIGFDLGFSPANNGFIPEEHSRGALKVSPDGSKVVAIHDELGAELLNFDAATGILSNRLILNTEDDGFGAEFSPNSTLVYITYRRYVSLAGDSNYYIQQFDLSSNDANTIINSGIVVTPPVEEKEIGLMQLAIDGKIYVSRSDQEYLGVINNPDVIGIGCNYATEGLYLGGRQSKIGLPSFVQSFFLSGITANYFCLGNTTEFNVNASESAISFLWDFGDGNTSTIEDPTHTYTIPGDYIVSVTAGGVTEIKKITIYEAPAANIVSDIEVCSIDNTLEIDLSLKDSEILGSQLNTDFTVNYFNSQSQAENGTNPLPKLYTNTNANETIFARIQNTANASCYAITSFEIKIKTSPVVNTIDDWIVCDDDGDGLFTFELSAIATPMVLKQNNPLYFNVSYYLSQTDLDNKSNPISTSFTNTLPYQTIFYRIENTLNPECYGEGTFQIEVIESVTANKLSNIEVCDLDNNGIAAFDLSSQDIDIIGAQNPSSLIVSYHKSVEDADFNINPLNTTNYINSNPYQETVYARISNASDTTCYDVTSFDLLIYDSPIVSNVEDWLVCDENNLGVKTLNLTEKDSDILNGQSITPFEVRYFLNESDALSDTNPILGDFINSTNPQEIYYRIQNKEHKTCFEVSSFEIEVLQVPHIIKPSDIVGCDINGNGIQVFDLSEVSVEALNGQDFNEIEVLFFNTEQDLLKNENKIENNEFKNTDLEEKLFIRVQNKRLPNCFSYIDFDVKVNSLPKIGLEETYVICPDSPELNIDGGEFESWVWIDQENNVIGNRRFLSVQNLGSYTLIVTETANGKVCEASESFEIVSSGAPESLSLATNGFTKNVIVTANASGTGDLEYSIDGTDFQDFNQFEVLPGQHTVFVRDKFLCRTISKEIFAVGYQAYFSPNGDGINETWNVVVDDSSNKSQVFIYDRYGKLIKQIFPESVGWDGTHQGLILPSSDYWFLYVDDEGNTAKGHFALVR